MIALANFMRLVVVQAWQNDKVAIKRPYDEMYKWIHMEAWWLSEYLGGVRG
jgi:hypothetical protein